MEINQVYQLFINDNFYIEIMYDGHNVNLVSPGNCQKEIISIVQTSNDAIIKYAAIPRCTIKLATGEVRNNRRLIQTAAIRNFSELFKEQDNKDLLDNQARFTKNTTEDIVNETELHTHFMEVLSGTEFLNLILKDLPYIGIDDDRLIFVGYKIDSSNQLFSSGVERWISREEIYSNRDIFNYLAEQLSITPYSQVSFDAINAILKRRNALFNLAEYCLSAETINNLDQSDENYLEMANAIRTDNKIKLYVDMLLECLRVLKNNGITYVELSFSNNKTIEKIYEELHNRKIVDGISFNFLLSVHREGKDSVAKNFREIYYEKGEPKVKVSSVTYRLADLINKGYAIGFDYMGYEREITEHDYLESTPMGDSMLEKLEPVLVKLNSFNRSDLVLRLHAGEILYPVSVNNDGKSNPHRTLEIIDKIVKKNNLTVPPPTIRLGHALHLDILDEERLKYLELLRKYRVVVEINASSNFTLNNVRNMMDIPYKWYISNGVPVVLGTDGGGFYLTTPRDESEIAQIFGGIDSASEIHEYDLLEAKRRGR